MHHSERRRDVQRARLAMRRDRRLPRRPSLLFEARHDERRRLHVPGLLHQPEAPALPEHHRVQRRSRLRDDDLQRLRGEDVRRSPRESLQVSYVRWVWETAFVATSFAVGEPEEAVVGALADPGPARDLLAALKASNRRTRAKALATALA